MTRLHRTPGLRVLECPPDAGPMVVAPWWHPDFDCDVEHPWLRERLAAVAAVIPDVA